MPMHEAREWISRRWPAVVAALVLASASGTGAASPPPPSPTAPAPSNDGRAPANSHSHDDSVTIDTSGVPEWMVRLAPDVTSPEAKQYAAQRKTRLQIERELKKLRAEYFRSTKNVQVRQVGISKLRAYSDAALFPLLIELFSTEDRDVRAAVLDHLQDQQTDEADASLAWVAVFDADPWYRGQALERVQRRVRDVGTVSNRVKWAAAAGLKSKDEKTIASAAMFARDLRMFDAIPTLINMQVGGGGAGGSGAGFGAGGGSFGDPGTSLAYIIVGTQQAFVSDLTPVVGDNAVAFDPTLSVATEGVVLRVIDAVVVTYRTEVNQALIALGNAGWDGRSTASMGWDQRAWRVWYANEFVPHRRQVEQGADKQASAGTSKP